MEIFKLFGSILIDNAKANESIAKTEEKAGGLAGKLGDAIKTGAKWAIGIAGAAVAAGSAIMGVALSAANAAGEIQDASQRVGMSAEEYQKYTYAAQQSGIEASKMEGLMLKQQKAFTDAKEGSEGMISAYERMGIKIQDVGSSSEAFDLVLKKLAGITDETERNSLANDIFGKSYADLTPLLLEGSDGIEALKQKAVDLGIVMSGDAVAAGANFGDTLDSLKGALGGVKNRIGMEFIPIMQSMGDWVINHMPEIQKVVETVFDVFSAVVEHTYNYFSTYLLPILETLFTWVNANMPTIKEVAKTVFDAITDVAKKVWHVFNDNVIPILKALWDFISPTFPFIRETIEFAFEAVIAIAQGVVDIFDAITGAIRTAIGWLTGWNNTEADDKTANVNLNGVPTDGRFATGLDYVPYNGFIAELHEGEKVLTKEQARKGFDNESQAIVIHNYNTTLLDGKVAARSTSRHQVNSNAALARALGVPV